jgi:kinase suppressor of Ras 2
MADEGLEVIQSMIDLSADRLEQLRTKCATSAELTQQETRSLETKLVRMFCELLLTRQNLDNEIPATSEDLRQWLRVVGLSQQTINAVIHHVNTLEALLQMNDDDICAILTNNQTVESEEPRRLTCAINNLKRCQQCFKTGVEPSDMFWDSWDRRNNIRSSKLSNNRLTTVIVNDQNIPDEFLQSPIELSPPDTQNSTSSLVTNGTLTSSSDKLLNMISPEEGSGVSNLSPSPSPPQSPSVYNTTSQSSSGSNNKRLATTPKLYNNNNNVLRFNGSNKDMTGSISSIGTSTTNSNNLNNNDITMSIDSDLDGMSKSKSNESQLSVNGRYNGSLTSCVETLSESAPIPAPRTRFSIHDTCELYHVDGTSAMIVSDALGPPRSPCTPIRAMHHIIQHRFSKKFKFTTSTCDLCNKQMFFGFKCTECKYRCHKDCKSNVPPSCGLPKGLVEEFRKTLHSNDGIMPTPSPNLPRAALMPIKRNEPRHRPPMHSIPFHGADSSSAGSSCNSSSPSSPALLTIPPQTPANKSQFNFPEISSASITNQNHQNSHHNGSYLPNTIIEDAEFETQTHSKGGMIYTMNIETKLGSIIDSSGELLRNFSEHC